ncbi:MAG TPA: hypothetical protein VK957_17475 [Lunatimonas sp.]|nr:hypothetical protein [Lunatimonas sp.]
MDYQEIAKILIGLRDADLANQFHQEDFEKRKMEYEVWRIRVGWGNDRIYRFIVFKFL